MAEKQQVYDFEMTQVINWNEQKVANAKQTVIVSGFWWCE